MKIKEKQNLQLLLEDIDDYLAYLEDFTHGEEGTKITHLRVRIEDNLKNLKEKN